MSKYTTEVRFICETLAGYDMSKGYGKVSEILEDSWDKVFDFNFPIFDEGYRSVLCQKILRHYYTREIGFETVGLWKLKLETKMQEIMPYYNKLYVTESLDFNPLVDANYTTTHEGSNTVDGTESNDHTGTVGDSGTHGGTIGDNGTHGGTVTDSGSKSGSVGDDYSEDGSDSEWNVFSDTPQGALTNVDNETYLTDARKITKEYEKDGSNDRTYSETNGNTRTYNETSGNTRTFNETSGNTRTYNESNDVEKSYNNTNEYVEHVIGKMPGKSYASMIAEYRSILLNIDVKIIDELKDLFMLVW